MSETTEPAIPIRAALPMEAYRSLLDAAEKDLGALSRTGVHVAWDVIEGRGATLEAVATIVDVAGGTLDLGTRLTYAGRWEAGGYVRWTRKQD
jgi:hypothetical protein